MGDTLTTLARRRGQLWADQAIVAMSNDVAWPTDTRILSRLAWLEVRDLPGDQAELVEAWISGAGSRWRSARDGRVSGEWRAVAG